MSEPKAAELARAKALGLKWDAESEAWAFGFAWIPNRKGDWKVAEQVICSQCGRTVGSGKGNILRFETADHSYIASATLDFRCSTCLCGTITVWVDEHMVIGLQDLRNLLAEGINRLVKESEDV